MSRTVIKLVWPQQKRTEKYREIYNSWGFAPVVWDYVYQKFCGGKPLEWIHNYERKILWGLYTDSDVPEHIRAVFMMTFDHAYLEVKHFKRAINDLKMFLCDIDHEPQFLKEGQPVNHWPLLIDILERDFISSPAIAFCMTTVSKDLWYDDGSTPIEWEKKFSVYKLLDEVEV